MPGYPFKKPPILAFRDERWELWLSTEDTGTARYGYFVSIDYSWHGTAIGWNTYSYYVVGPDHVRKPVVTLTRYEAELKQVAACADARELDRAVEELDETFVVLPDTHLLFKLRDHWEALLRLGVVQPRITV